MPRLPTVPDMLRAARNWVNGTARQPRSAIIRSAQRAVVRLESRAAANAALAEFHAIGFTLESPDKWRQQNLIVDAWEVSTLPALRNAIQNTGDLQRFPPELLPRRMIESARRWADGERGLPPDELTRRCRRAVERLRPRSPSEPLSKPRAAVTRAYQVVGNPTARRAYALAS